MGPFGFKLEKIQLILHAGDDKKVLCQAFPKLYIPDAVDDQLIRRLKLYIDAVTTVRPLLFLIAAAYLEFQRRPLKDTSSRNTLSKFDALVSKKFEKQLELKEEELRKLEELQDLFDFLDDIIPEDEGELVDPEPKKRGRKRSIILPHVIFFPRLMD